MSVKNKNHHRFDNAFCFCKLMSNESLPSLYKRREIEDLVELGVSASFEEAEGVTDSGSVSTVEEVVSCLSKHKGYNSQYE